jgi:SAM-dependent methyltransferase
VADLFDTRALALRRDRASRLGSESFLHERVFEDILDRLSIIRRKFESALVLGTVDDSWPERLAPFVSRFEAASDSLDFDAASFDLSVVVGVLDTVNDLPGALLRLRYAMRPDSLLIGAIPGGDTLPRLRAAMRAADSVAGEAVPRVHPRIEAASLGQLLAAAGFRMPVVDVDRVKVAYRSLAGLVADLRRMGATNVLTRRSRQILTRASLAAAQEEFARNQENGRTTEIFELLHFAAWS